MCACRTVGEGEVRDVVLLVQAGDTDGGCVARKAQTVGDLEAEVKALRKTNRELVRVNEILKAATAFFGVEIDRQSQR